MQRPSFESPAEQRYDIDCNARQGLRLLPRPSVLLVVERVDVQEDALEVRIRTEGLASLVGELRQDGERVAA